VNRYSPAQLAVGVVIAMAVAALLYLAAGALGIAIPAVFVNVVWVLLIAVILIAAILFLFSLAKQGP
jgi:hypothetical protein